MLKYVSLHLLYIFLLSIILSIHTSTNLNIKVSHVSTEISSTKITHRLNSPAIKIKFWCEFVNNIYKKKGLLYTKWGKKKAEFNLTNQYNICLDYFILITSKTLNYNS